MPNQNLTDLIAEVTRAETIEESAIAFINGVPALVQTAVDAALANGATEAELAPLSTLVTDLRAKSDALSAAIVANTK